MTGYLTQLHFKIIGLDVPNQTIYFPGGSTAIRPISWVTEQIRIHDENPEDVDLFHRIAFHLSCLETAYPIEKTWYIRELQPCGSTHLMCAEDKRCIHVFVYNDNDTKDDKIMVAGFYPELMDFARFVRGINLPTFSTRASKGAFEISKGIVRVFMPRFNRYYHLSVLRKSQNVPGLIWSEEACRCGGSHE